MNKTKDVLPQKVDDATFAFPGSVSHLMPEYNEIPDEFRRGHTKWNQFFNDAFFSGCKDVKYEPKEGIDPETAFRHVHCVMRSFEPKHEHKEAAVAYLLSLWFNDLTWSRKDA